jgi:hypothetical protein
LDCGKWNFGARKFCEISFVSRYEI